MSAISPRRNCPQGIKCKNGSCPHMHANIPTTQPYAVMRACKDCENCVNPKCRRFHFFAIYFNAIKRFHLGNDKNKVPRPKSPVIVPVIPMVQLVPVRLVEEELHVTTANGIMELFPDVFGVFVLGSGRVMLGVIG